MPYQTVWVEPEVLYSANGVSVLAAYEEDDFEDPLHFWVVPIPEEEDLSAESDFESVDLRDLGMSPACSLEAKLAFIRQAVGEGRLKPKAGLSMVSSSGEDP